MPGAIFIQRYYHDGDINWNDLSKCKWIPILRCYWEVRQQDLHLLGNPIFFPDDEDSE